MQTSVYSSLYKRKVTACLNGTSLPSSSFKVFLLKLLWLSFFCVCLETEVSAAQVTWSIAKNTQCCFEFLSILLMPFSEHQDRKHRPPHPDTFVFFMFVKERYKEPSSPKANIMFLNFSELHTHWKKEQFVAGIQQNQLYTFLLTIL